MDFVSYLLFWVGMATLLGSGIAAIFTENTRPLLLALAVAWGIFACWNVYRYLWEDHEYKAVNGKAEVRHGRLGHWEPLEQHLRDKHGIEV